MVAHRIERCEREQTRHTLVSPDSAAATSAPAGAARRFIRPLPVLGWVVLIACWCAAAVHANGSPVAIIVFADDFDEVEVLDFAGNPTPLVDFGTEVLAGFAVRTGDSTAELRLEHNGSVMRLATDTFLRIDDLQGVAGSQVNSASLFDGQLRMVAAHAGRENYRITTRSVVLGVRGTDFSVAVSDGEGDGDGDGDEATVAVDDGVVAVYHPETKESVEVKAGEALNVRDRVMNRIDRRVAAISERLSNFEGINLRDVPREARDRARNAFDYFQEIDLREYRQSFERESLFSNAEENAARFNEYYEERLSDVRDRLERRRDRLQERVDAIQDSVRNPDRD